jgi:APA family basic amino acid/polyamine antiporter
VVANVIGTGVFTTTGFLCDRLGSAANVLLVWALGGLLALCGAAVYGELGAMLPRAGGEYVYLSRAFHPGVGFVSGWVSLFVGFAAPVALGGQAFGAYLHAAVPWVPVQAAGVLLIAGLSALHMGSVREGRRVQRWLTSYKVALIVGFIAAAFVWGEGSFAHFEPRPADVEASDLAVALVLVSFAYLGWNAAAYLAGEIKDVGRALPRSLLGGTVLVVVLYLGLNVAFLYAAPPEALAAQPEQVGAVAASALFGGTGGGAFSLLVALALSSSVSAMTMAGPQIYMAMAEDGLFFRALARRSRDGAPVLGIALQGGLAILMLLTSTFLALLTYVGFTLSIFAALTVVSAFVLRRREPEALRPYKVTLWPIPPLLFLALSIWMVILALLERPAISFAGLATLASGLVAYALRAR